GRVQVGVRGPAEGRAGDAQGRGAAPGRDRLQQPAHLPRVQPAGRTGVVRRVRADPGRGTADGHPQPGEVLRRGEVGRCEGGAGVGWRGGSGPTWCSWTPTRWRRSATSGGSPGWWRTVDTSRRRN